MKIIEDYQDYRAEGQESLARFINEFIENFWANVGVDVPREKYFDINQALAAAIRNNVQIIGAMWTAGSEMTNVVTQIDIEKEAQYLLARMLSDELMHSNFVAVRVMRSRFHNSKEYRVTLPIVAFKESK